MTNTRPRVAKVGLNEMECAQLKQKQKTALVPLDAVSASNTSDLGQGCEDYGESKGADYWSDRGSTRGRHRDSRDCNGDS